MADNHKTHQQEHDGNENQQEALHLKTLAESKYNSSSLKSALKLATRAHRLCSTLPGLSEMLTAFKILNSAIEGSSTSILSPEFYAILGLDPFSPLTAIKAQYKKLALILHPDKTKSTLKNASCEAFNLVNDAFQVLSDKTRRKEYDTKLRLALQSAAAAEVAEEEVVVEETFWTACCKCRLLHEFERKYVGHSLVCPNCNEGFRAVEVNDDVDVEGGGGDDDVEESGGVRRSARVRVRKRVFGKESPVSDTDCVNEVVGRGKMKRGEGAIAGKKVVLGLKSVSSEPKGKMGSVNEVIGSVKSKRVRVEVVSEKSGNDNSERQLDKEGPKNGDMKRRMSNVVEGSVREGTKQVKEVERELTLAEMKLEALKNKRRKEDGKKEKVRKENEEVEKKGNRLLPLGASGDMEVMVVQDSDFYDFDEDRVERSFKKGQVWAIYDDDDGMPRHYGLIEEVVSVNPFQVKMSWLDLQNNGDERLICWEKMGFHVSCGKFKVARKDTIKLLNIFSHLVAFERAARELYRVYPRKGSVWALYNEKALGIAGRSSLGRDRRHYDIVLLLTSFSEMHGLSMVYLEKVDGFRAVFKRREIGYHAIRWLEKDDIRLFSHQIPARKLSGNEAPDLSGDCWELDPASLPPNMLAIT